MDHCFRCGNLASQVPFEIEDIALCQDCVASHSDVSSPPSQPGQRILVNFVLAVLSVSWLLVAFFASFMLQIALGPQTNMSVLAIYFIVFLLGFCGFNLAKLLLERPAQRSWFNSQLADLNYDSIVGREKLRSHLLHVYETKAGGPIGDKPIFATAVQSRLGMMLFIGEKNYVPIHFSNVKSIQEMSGFHSLPMFSKAIKMTMRHETHETGKNTVTELVLTVATHFNLLTNRRLTGDLASRIRNYQLS